MTRELLDTVREDSTLTPAEKETSIHFAKDEDTARIFTAESGLARRTLAHPHADVRLLNVVLDDGTRTTVEPEEYEEGRIVAVAADLPVGLLTIGVAPRQTTQHAPVITERVLSEVEA